MRKVTVLAFIALSLLAVNAMAESIDGRLGLTGKLGVIVPLANSEIKGSTFWLSDTGFAAGGGLIYGFGKNFAAELDVTHVPSLDVKMGTGAKISEAQFTDVSLGLLYRIMPAHRFVPYIGGGADFIKGDIENTSLDWTVGGHANGGLDYFVNNSIVLNIDCRAVFAEKSDIQMNGVNVGKFDPMNVVTTFGVRLFLPENWWNN